MLNKNYSITYCLRKCIRTGKLNSEDMSIVKNLTNMLK